MTASFASKLSASQLMVANAVASLEPNDRLVVVGRVGSGKSYAVASGLANRLSGSRGARIRILIVAGAHALAEQWAWIFREIGSDALVVDPSEFRDLQLHTPTDDNPWDTPRAQLVATYIDFAKAPERLEQMLESQWDIVVLDDLPASKPESLRHRALSGVWESHRPFARVLVVRTGDSGMAADAFDASVLNVEVPTPDWALTEVWVAHTAADAAILGRVYAGVSRLPKIVRETMLRRAGSSLFALEQSLARLTLRVPEGLPTLEASDERALDPFEEATIVTEIGSILDLIESIEIDSKWETLRSLIERISLPGPVVVFTDYADTAEYLTYLFESEDIPATAITSRMGNDERAAAIERAHHGRCVLVVSNPTWTQRLEVAGVVHYDLPVDPKCLEERAGSVTKLQSDVEYFVVVDPAFEKLGNDPDDSSK